MYRCCCHRRRRRFTKMIAQNKANKWDIDIAANWKRRMKRVTCSFRSILHIECKLALPKFRLSLFLIFLQCVIFFSLAAASIRICRSTERTDFSPIVTKQTTFMLCIHTFGTCIVTEKRRESEGMRHCVSVSIFHSHISSEFDLIQGCALSNRRHSAIANIEL